MKCNKCGKEFDGNFCPQVGNAVLFTDADESKQVLTIESCEPYTDSLGTFTRVNYKIENTGDIEVYTVDWNFQLYADNQVVQTYVSRLSAWRNINEKGEAF